MTLSPITKALAGPAPERALRDGLARGAFTLGELKATKDLLRRVVDVQRANRRELFVSALSASERSTVEKMGRRQAMRMLRRRLEADLEVHGPDYVVDEVRGAVRRLRARVNGAAA